MNKKNIDIDSLVSLASFFVSGDEKEKIANEIENLLEYANVLNRAPLDNLLPSYGAEDCAGAPELRSAYREDAAIKWRSLDMMLNNSPHVDNTSYVIPPLRGKSGVEEETDENTALKTDAGWEAVIGLEVHAQLKTRSKLFCSCPSEFGSSPNENTCPVCTGQPGALPVLNREAVKMTVTAGLAANCSINKKSVFARKNYFYPDLPKGYQISQFEEPICSGGFIEIEIDGIRRKIRLNRIHMEEDAGKMVHIGSPGIWGSKASAVDYNRSSVPLMEIVTEPDLRSAAEAKEFVIILRSILVSHGLCDGNLEEGSLRCDANISIRPQGDSPLGVKTEIKNMNSFKAIERAVEFEIERQKKMKRLGREIFQETRLWDESSQKTIIMRSKEESHDYRYFPDPDLLPLVIDGSIIHESQSKIRELPLEKIKRFESECLLNCAEARLLAVNPGWGDYFDALIAVYGAPRPAANWFFNEILCYISGNIGDIHIAPEDLAGLLKKIDCGEISGKMGKAVIKKSFEMKKCLSEIIEQEGLKQITDRGAIEDVIIKILAENPEQVSQYKSGKTRVFGHMVGEAMKRTKGKANPQLVNEILKTKIDEA